MSMRPEAWPTDPDVNQSHATAMGLKGDEWPRLLELLGRTPTYAELGVFSAMWSEHCSYKSSRVHLKRLPTTGPKVVQGPGENAGAVDIGDGYCAVFKIESHNHPSYIEPYQGAATGVGGILRDVFTMGARPIALLNALRFGETSHAKTGSLVRGVVAGIAGYGNAIGVPTVGGDCYFDASYNQNCLVNAFALGIARTDELFFGKATGVGNKLIYVGAKTGRDGIHGATMASQEFDQESQKKRPTVQVGDPFTEKLLLEACLEIFKAGALLGVQDMGAAGLTSSSVEMAARAGTGLLLDLDKVPRRTAGMSPYELLLSESQERMLMVAKPGSEEVVFAICKKWDLDVAIIGEVTDSQRWICKATPGYDPFTHTTRPNRDAVVVADIAVDVLADQAPMYERPVASDYTSRLSIVDDEKSASFVPQNAQALKADWLEVLGSVNVGSRRAIWQQYDHIVRNGTMIRPGAADAAIVRAVTEVGEKYLALAVDGNGRYVELDPYHGAAMAVAECARNLVCVGATPLGLTNCLNFGSAENPRVMHQLSRAIDGIRDACVRLEVPVVSGNVSLYNETDGQPIQPTPVVAIVGSVTDPDAVVTMAFKQAGDAVVLLGSDMLSLGGSEWLAQKAGAPVGPALQINLDAEAQLQRCLSVLIGEGLVQSAHDISEGGLAACLSESALAADVGVRLVMDADFERLVACLFSEAPSRVVISCAHADYDALLAQCQREGVSCELLGYVGGDAIEVGQVMSIGLSELRVAYDAALGGVL